ncbi:hypothetical protein [Streptomyces sp. NPDC046860]|uniref:hypothetical protein n=1 Tax=Streptomyces sp. NPDC046860 TaxID=3154495 RepID=UPI003403916B
MQPLGADEPAAVGPYRLLGRLGSGGMGRVAGYELPRALGSAAEDTPEARLSRVAPR